MARALVFLLVAVLIWGVQPIVIKIVLGFFSVNFTAFARCAAAAVFFGIAALVARSPAVPPASPLRLSTRRLVIWLLVGGIGLGLGNILWNASLTRTTVGACSVLQICGNLVIALYGILVLRERCGPLRAGGLILSLVGMFVICWNGESLSALARSQYFRGNMLALASGVAWGLCAIAQKVSVPGRSSMLVVVPIFGLSALTCGAAALSSPVLIADYSGLMLAALVLTGLIGTGVGNVLFTESMRIVTASVAAASLAACPLLSLVSANMLLGERATIYLLAGAPLTCAGIAAAVVSEPGGIASQQR